jgi:hypothetical protein
MFLQTTPDTSGYMIAGYVVAFTVIGLYLMSMYVRRHNLNRDLEALQSMRPEKPATKPKKKKK